jgi:anti-anti-sigma factor
MLRLTMQNLGDVTVFRLAGRITAGDFDGLCNAVRSQPDTRVAVLDMGEVIAIDAAGVGILLSLHAWLRIHNTQLKLMNLTPWVEEVLEITRVRSTFDICSVHDMVDLLCRASDPSRFAAAAAVGPPFRPILAKGGVSQCISDAGVRLLLLHFR